LATDAQKQNARSITYSKAKDILDDDRAVMLIFGTAWGLDKEIINHADYILDPIMGPTDYNHLSVRTAAAIILDRLAGRQPEQ
jgi:hypothetical protein